MFRSIAIIFSILFFTSLCFSQTAPATAPAKWQNYSVPDRDVSILLPKLPVFFNRPSPCSGEDRREYGAYSDGVVYVFAVVVKADRSSYCRNAKPFDETSFENRIADLRNDRWYPAEETEVDNGGQKWKRLQNKKGIYLLYNDFANKRWYELWAFGADEKKPDVKRYFESLKIEKKPAGIKIGAGSDVVLGDETAGQPGDASVETAKPAGDPALPGAPKNDPSVTGPIVVLNPRPVYTEEARRNHAGGTIKLRVTFLSNGSTGAISVVDKELPYGLTEQAIIAARQTFFVPAKKEGKPITTEKILEYSFTIY